MNKLIMHLLEVFILTILLIASTTGSTTITPVMDTSIKNIVSLASKESNIEPFVVGGHDAKPGEFPWIVNIQIVDNTNPAFRTLCGGTIINLDLVITAAHCVCHGYSNSVVEYQNVQLTAGEYNMSKADGSEQRVSVREIRVHEEFYWDRTTLRNDIALIKLEHKFKKSKLVDKIELPNFDVLRNPQIVRVAGWGDTDSRHIPSDILQTVDIEIWKGDKCNLLDNNLQICAGGNGKDSCLGDSGGPLICSYEKTTYLCGIVSYGTGRICGESPGVYTNVYGYQKWILENQEFSNVFYQVILAFIVFSIIISSVVGIAYFLSKKFSSPHYCQMEPIE